MKILVLLCAVLTLSACGAAKEPSEVVPNEAEIRAAIQSETDKFGLTIQKKDHAGFGALFTEDATWILPDATVAKGRPAIEAGQKAFMKTFEAVTAGSQVIDKLLIISNSEAVTFASVNFTMTSNGKTVNLVNPYAAYWRKGEDGVWRVAYDVNAIGPLR